MTAKFETFAALHVPGDPVILFNVWDAGSAAVAEKAGAKAIATGSASVATAHGCPDAEGLPLGLALANAERVVASVSLPVSIDFEGAYSTDPDIAAANLVHLAATGAVGCNFEDQVIGAEPRALHATADQVGRIAAMRAAVGAAFFINARIDLFITARPEARDDAMVDAALVRAEAYAAAGANGIFVPLLADLRLLERFCRACPLPVNFMAFPGGPTAAEVAETGVARISHGPFPHMAALKSFEDAAREAFGG
ncbi:MAG: isocitrate lyase/phosphoenolpyruvate mutase family protein [Pseudomonadota bacterium]